MGTGLIGMLRASGLKMHNTAAIRPTRVSCLTVKRLLFWVTVVFIFPRILPFYGEQAQKSRQLYKMIVNRKCKTDNKQTI